MLLHVQRTTRSRVAATKALAHDENAVPKPRAAVKGKTGGTTKEAAKPTITKKTLTTTVPKRAALGEVASNQAAVKNDTKSTQVQPAKRAVRAPTQKKALSVVPEVQEKVKETMVVKREVETRRTVKLAKQEPPVKDLIKKENNAEPVPHVNPKHVMVDASEALPVAKKAKTAAPAWEDLDADDANDPMMVSEYVNEIFEYMRQLEIDTLPGSDYMDEQKELQWNMRSILVDWLIEVHYKFRLLPETLYLAVNIVDRFLTLRVVSLVKLQLVGVTALFIAAKYEEVVAPSIQNFIYMADGGYTDEEILKAERYVLQVLDFALQYPSPMSFLRRCSKADQYDIHTRTVAKYLMEISLVDHRFLVHVPSKVAAASMSLARRMLGRVPWDAQLEYYAGYPEEEIEPAVNLMISFLENESMVEKCSSLFKKYSARKFMKASIFVQDWISRRKQPTKVQSTVKPEREEDVKENGTE
ncbi:hypothetical protein SpCBS45565_g07675 [Spizellomyces sp. 'palustris']|nr:hypothetical protein SpCBS45565_g07675 [Spizellomyces sp. 'palustris']